VEPLIVTACTADYQSHAREFAASARRQGLQVRVLRYRDQGAWIDNCRQKPILLDALLRRRGGEPARPLLWVDADGLVLRRPDPELLRSLASGCDFAACPSRAGLGRRYCTGTLWINAAPAAARFVACWAGLCRQSEGTDEAALDRVVRTGVPGVRLGELPFTWGWLPRDGPRTARTVIAHRLSGNARRAQPRPPISVAR
jgi:hypothetical protein